MNMFFSSTAVESIVSVSNTLGNTPSNEIVLSADELYKRNQIITPYDTVSTQNNIFEVDHLGLLFIIWLLGIFLSLYLNLTSYYRFIRYIKDTAYTAYDNEMLLLAEVKTAQHVVRKITLLRSRFAHTPMIVGFIRPCIILPVKEYTNNQLHNILLHELTHIKRCDIAIKWFTTLVVAIHWFNPIIYFMRREINFACELSCDEAVIKELNAKDRQDYGETLMFVAVESSYSPGGLSTTMCEGKKVLKERLVSIMKYSNKTKKTVFLSFTIVFLLISSAVALGASPVKDTETVTEGFSLPWFFLSSEAKEQRRRDETVQLFEIYDKYGLVYNKERDRLYYNGELVRYFEDIINKNDYKKWPSKDGNIDVFAVRNANGELTGVELFSQQQFDERTTWLDGAIYALQITKSISITNSNTRATVEDNSNNYNSNESTYYTKEMEQLKKQILEQIYEEYRQYGLIYDKDSDSLFYNTKPVSYFEDKAMFRFFGSYEDGGNNIYAIRDSSGNLTGLNNSNR